MATKQIKCEDCQKKDCPQRVLGAVCSINSELSSLTVAAKSRDPLLVAQFIVSMVGSEYDRYEKAKKLEAIGKKTQRTVVTKLGETITIDEVNNIDNNVSNLAMNIIRAGKMLNEILNPPKTVPFNQTNIQNNFGVAAADEIRNLTGKEREKALQFIDEKLDAKRAN